MTYQPISITIPNRKPFVRGYTFVDGQGPPPSDFFDETQDHLSALVHSMVGWKWSAGVEDFASATYPGGYVGVFRIAQNSGPGKLTTTAVLNPTEQGLHGVWKGTSGFGGFAFEMQTGDSAIGRGDFLYTAKVQLDTPYIDNFENQGFHIAMGPTSSGLPGFAMGQNSPNWQVFTPLREGGPSVYIDTGVPVLQNKFYVLQWGRSSGGLRFFINNKLISIPNESGTLLPGVYWPANIRGAKRYLTAQQSWLGPSTDVFEIDFFHCLLERVG